MNEIMQTLMPYIMAVGVAALVYAAQWFRAKTLEIAESSKVIKEATVQNTELLEKNTKLTEKIENHSNGMSEKLARIAAASAFAAGRIKGMDDTGSKLSEADQAELDEFERGNVSLNLKDSGG